VSGKSRARGVLNLIHGKSERDVCRYPAFMQLWRECRTRSLQSGAGVVRALRDGTESMLADPHPAIGEIARAGGADGELVRAQLKAVAPILRPPLRLNRDALERWADFDGRFGILRHRPNVDRAFAFDLAE
jgi:hypothetical protein